MYWNVIEWSELNGLGKCHCMRGCRFGAFLLSSQGSFVRSDFVVEVEVKGDAVFDQARGAGLECDSGLLLLLAIRFTYDFADTFGPREERDFADELSSLTVVFAPMIGVFAAAEGDRLETFTGKGGQQMSLLPTTGGLTLRSRRRTLTFDDFFHAGGGEIECWDEVSMAHSS